MHSDQVFSDQDKADFVFADIGQVLVAMVQIKTFMLREGISEFQTECPRCCDILRARLMRPNNHIRMACDGQCGMSCLE